MLQVSPSNPKYLQVIIHCFLFWNALHHATSTLHRSPASKDVHFLDRPKTLDRPRPVSRPSGLPRPAHPQWAPVQGAKLKILEKKNRFEEFWIEEFGWHPNWMAKFWIQILSDKIFGISWMAKRQSEELKDAPEAVSILGTEDAVGLREKTAFFMLHTCCEFTIWFMMCILQFKEFDTWTVYSWRCGNMWSFWKTVCICVQFLSTSFPPSVWIDHLECFQPSYHRTKERAPAKATLHLAAVRYVVSVSCHRWFFQHQNVTGPFHTWKPWHNIMWNTSIYHTFIKTLEPFWCLTSFLIFFLSSYRNGLKNHRLNRTARPVRRSGVRGAHLGSRRLRTISSTKTTETTYNSLGCISVFVGGVRTGRYGWSCSEQIIPKLDTPALWPRPVKSSHFFVYFASRFYDRSRRSQSLKIDQQKDFTITVITFAHSEERGGEKRQ